MWPNPQETGDLVTFTEEILIEKFHIFAVISTDLIVNPLTSAIHKKDIYTWTKLRLKVGTKR